MRKQNNNKERRYLIECGSGFGGTIKQFSETALYDRYDWKIYAFEANSEMVIKTKTHCAHLPQPDALEVIEAALSNQNGSIVFYLAANPTSGSILKEKVTGGLDAENPVIVTSIYLGDWIRERFSKMDYIVVSMNVEGAEYQLIDRMLQDGSIEYVNEMYVDFHNQKVGISKNKDLEIINKVMERGIKLIPRTLKNAIRDGEIQ